MTLLRRFLTIAALMVWQGGFIFYTAVVVPIGTEVTGSSLRQGFITRQVTAKMNVCGAIALALMAPELCAPRSGTGCWQRARLTLFALMIGAAIALFALYPRLDALLDSETESIIDRQAFRPLHRIYLWVSSGQWACAVIYLALTLATWRKEDRAAAIAASAR
jgi:hypothetical protein